MAKKVINTKVVSVIVIAAMCIAIGFFAAKKIFRIGAAKPEKLIAIADNAMKVGEYKIAAEHYQGAAGALNDPAYWLKAGEAFNMLGYEDQEYLLLAQRCWETAVSTDPRNVAALERVLQDRMDIVEYGAIRVGRRPQNKWLEDVAQKSRKLLTVDPKNKLAKPAAAIATIQGVLNNVETDSARIDQAVKELKEAQELDPSNDDVVWYLSLAMTTQARKARKELRDPDADALELQAKKVIDDAIATQPQNGVLLYRRSQVLATTPLTKPGATTKPADQVALIKQRVQAVRAELEAALKLVKPTDPKYPEIAMSTATYQGFDQDQPAAEATLRELVKNRPNEWTGYVRLAELLSAEPSRRVEAANLLKTPLQAEPAAKAGWAGYLLQSQEMEAKIRLVDISLDIAAADQNADTRKAEFTQVEKLLGEVETKVRSSNNSPDQPILLRLRGKLQFFNGNSVEAAQVFRRALDQMAGETNTPLGIELRYMLAVANRKNNQTGQAKALLSEIVAQRGDNMQARLTLAETLVADGDNLGAKEQLTVLEKNMPNEPMVQKLWIRVLDPKTDRDRLRALFAKLPEANRAQKIDKAILLSDKEQHDLAKPLLVSALEEKPDDERTRQLLARVLDRGLKDTAGAIALVEDGLKRDPKSLGLSVTLKLLKGEKINDIADDDGTLDQITDPLNRELAYVERAIRQGNDAEVLKHLAAAEKINPASEQVLRLYFGYYLRIRDYTKANEYAGRLGKIDADKADGKVFKLQIVLEQNDLKEAYQQAVELTKFRSEFSQSWYWLGQVLQRQRRYEEAIVQYTQAIEKSTSDVDVYRGIIQCFYMLEKNADAKKWIDKAIETTRQNPYFLELAAEHETRFGDPEKTIPMREKAFADKPEQVQTAVALGSAYITVARSKQAKGDAVGTKAYLDKARAHLVACIAKYPDSLQFVGQYGDVSILSNNTADGDAKWAALAANEKWASRPEPIQFQASYLLRTQRPDAAEKVLRDGLERLRNQPEIQIQLADLLMNQRKFDEALKVVGDSPADSRAQEKRAEILVNAGRFDEAEKVVVERIAKQKPTSQLLTQLAMLQANGGRLEEATKSINEAVALDPENVSAVYQRATITLSNPTGNLDSAITDLIAVREAAGAASSKFEQLGVPARYQLANAYQRKKDLDSTLKSLEGVLQLAPSEKLARLQLMEIYATQFDPPRWLDADRVARDAKAFKALAEDSDIINSEARLLIRKGDFIKAVELTTAAVAKQPEVLSIQQAHFDALLGSRNYQGVLDATAKFEAAGKKKFWWVYNVRGIARARMRDRVLSMEEFKTALQLTFDAKQWQPFDLVIKAVAKELGPKDSDATFVELASGSVRWKVARATMLQLSGEVNRARSVVAELIGQVETKEFTPDEQWNLYKFIGSCYMADPPDLANAKLAFEQAVKLNPRDYSSLNNLSYISGSDIKKALEFSQRAYDMMLQLNEYVGRVADTHGYNLVLNGELDKGLSILLEAARIEAFPEVLAHICEAHLKKGSIDDAQRYYQQTQDAMNKYLAAKQYFDPLLTDKMIELDGLIRAAKKK